MTRFAAVLRDLDDRLALSHEARARILLEVAADLEDACADAISGGLTPAEAEQLVVERFTPTDETLAQLERIHGGPLACFFDGVSTQLRSLWERLWLLTVGFFVIVTGGQLLLDRGIFISSEPWSWATLGLAAVSLLLVLNSVYVLAIRQDHRPRVLRRGLGTLLLLAVFLLAASVVLVLANSLMWLTAAISLWPADGQLFALDELHRVSALATITLTEAIITALAWFFLNQRVSIIEERAAKVLLDLERS